MIEELRKEYYFREDSPLVCDEHGNFHYPRKHWVFGGFFYFTTNLHFILHFAASDKI